MKVAKNKPWGQLTAIDLRGCDPEMLLSRRKLTSFCKRLCKEIGMKAHGKPFIDQFGEGDLYGLSAVQFIETSTITVHLDDKGDRAFIDVFSCKVFDEDVAVNFSKKFWKAREVKFKTLYRK